MVANVQPEFGKGIRIFAGDVLKMERKHGANVEAIAAALEASPIRLTVTGTGSSERYDSPFVRFCFECPFGVFVNTVRGHDLPDGVDGIARSAHKRLTLMRWDMESFLINPKASALEAARDLAQNGLLIEAQQLQGEGDKGNSRIRIFASPLWNVARSELVGRPRREVIQGQPLLASLSAFQRAAEELLPDSLLEAVRGRASELLTRRP